MDSMGGKKKKRKTNKNTPKIQYFAMCVVVLFKGFSFGWLVLSFIDLFCFILFRNSDSHLLWR